MDNALFYRCEICGNIVALLKVGGGTLTCCGQQMTKLVANSTDAAQEKHVPVAVKKGEKIQVTVGSVMHPKTEEHHIEWIAMATDNKIEIIYLKPGMDPKAEFSVPVSHTEAIYTGENDEEVMNCEGQPCNFVCRTEAPTPITIYAYCNIHGLWKSKL